MANLTPAKLGTITASCNVCGDVQEVQATSTEMREIDGSICLVVHMASADLELHMLNHNMCSCEWQTTTIGRILDGEPITEYHREYDPACEVHTS